MKNDQNNQLVKVEEIDTGYEDEQLDYENLDELEEGMGFITTVIIFNFLGSINFRFLNFRCRSQLERSRS